MSKLYEDYKRLLKLKEEYGEDQPAEDPKPKEEPKEDDKPKEDKKYTLDEVLNLFKDFIASQDKPEENKEDNENEPDPNDASKKTSPNEPEIS